MKLIFPLLIILVACHNKQPEIKQPTSFKIDSSTTMYWISDTIDVDDGKNETVRVFFQCVVNSTTWDSLSRIYNGSDERLFYWIADGISLDAKYKLNNPQSFQPFKKQFLLVDGKRFICDYGLFGRNGIGNLTEGKVFAEYKPFEDSALFKYKR
jgi:hypothetical protein